MADFQQAPTISLMTFQLTSAQCVNIDQWRFNNFSIIILQGAVTLETTKVRASLSPNFSRLNPMQDGDRIQSVQDGPQSVQDGDRVNFPARVP